MATAAITLHLWFTLPIVSNPVCLYIEDRLKINETTREFTYRMLLRMSLLAFETIIACVVPFFFDVMAIIGATTVSATVFFLPCLMYLSLKWTQVSRVEVFGIGCVMLFATVGSVIGCYHAVLSIINDLGGLSIAPPVYVFYSVLGGTTVVGGVAIVYVIYRIGHQPAPSSYFPIF